MEKLTISEFGEQVRKYVKAGLPSELKGAKVYVTQLDIRDGVTQMVLLVIRPWNGVVTGFHLDNWYDRYAEGNTTIESAAASVINDRRLYNVFIE